MMAKKIAFIGSILFLLIGILGLVPSAIVYIYGMPHIFGLFMVDAIHTIIHIASGVIGLLAASSERYATWYLQIFGIVYAVVAVMGLLQGDTVLGLFAVNMADNVLHIILALVLLVSGFLLPAHTASNNKIQ